MNDLLVLLLVYLRLSLLAVGGGIAVLPEMQRQVVESRGWLTDAQFRDSFALGQLTPGPGMLMVIVAGYRVAGVPGAIVAAVGMFLPTACLTHIVARSWERLRDHPWRKDLQAGLAPVSVGLLLAGSYTLLRSAVHGPATAAIAAAATLAVLRWKVSPAAVIGCAAVAGLLLR